MQTALGLLTDSGKPLHDFSCHCWSKQCTNQPCEYVTGAKSAPEAPFLILQMLIHWFLDFSPATTIAASMQGAIDILAGMCDSRQAQSLSTSICRLSAARALLLIVGP